MKYAVDLHIHSALSPCSDSDMTPNNIVNMALLKGLDAIAVTDHNSGANLEAVRICAEKSGLVFVPGMEVETCEEVHLVCLLPDLKRSLELHRQVYQSLPDRQNRKEIFGIQSILNEKDQLIREEERMLIAATSLSCTEVFTLVRGLGGAVIPAHVDRPANSMLSNLGFIPEDLTVKFLEISKNCDPFLYRSKHPEWDCYSFIKSSDAHNLGDILERETYLELKEISPMDIISLFV